MAATAATMATAAIALPAPDRGGLMNRPQHSASHTSATSVPARRPSRAKSDPVDQPGIRRYNSTAPYATASAPHATCSTCTVRFGVVAVNGVPALSPVKAATTTEKTIAALVE